MVLVTKSCFFVGGARVFTGFCSIELLLKRTFVGC